MHVLAVIDASQTKAFVATQVRELAAWTAQSHLEALARQADNIPRIAG